MQVSNMALKKLHQDYHLSNFSCFQLKAPLKHQKDTHMIRAPSLKPQTYYKSKIAKRQRIQQGISDLDYFCHSVSIYCLASYCIAFNNFSVFSLCFTYGRHKSGSSSYIIKGKYRPATTPTRGKPGVSTNLV